MPHARELVTGFPDAVHLSFAFLLRTPGVVVSSNVVTFAAGSLRTVTPADMPDYFFAASVEMSSPTWRVQVRYGEREFELNLLLSLQPHQLLDRAWIHFSGPVLLKGPAELPAGSVRRPVRGQSRTASQVC